MALNDKQIRFCEEYLIDFNATQAAISSPIILNFYLLKLSALKELSYRMSVFGKKELTSGELNLCFGLIDVLMDKASNIINRSAAVIGLDFLMPEWRQVAPIEVLGTISDRESKEVYEWKRKCLKRDNNACVKCGGFYRLAVHHICHWANFPYLRLIESNGQTLCGHCHSKEHPTMGSGMFIRESKIDKVDNGAQWS